MLLFLLGCMGARLAIAFLAKTIPLDYLPYMGFPALAIAAGFAAIYVGGLRPTGIEVGGGRIWWDALRPVHAALWTLFALLAFRKQRSAWLVLLADALLGLAAFLAFHFVLDQK
jgi:hypothetical protein